MGSNQETLRAHPAFLDAIRAAGELPTLLNATGDTLAGTLGKWRVTLDSHLVDVPAARTAFGLAAGRFTTLGEELALLQHFTSVRSLPGLWNAPTAAAALAFADAHPPVSVARFTQRHAFFLTAVGSFGGPWDPNT